MHNSSATLGSSSLRECGSASAFQPSFVFGGLMAVLTGLYVALVPSINVLPGVDLYNSKRLLQVALLLGVGAWLLSSKQARMRWLQTFKTLPLAARWGFAIVLCLGALSAVQAAVPRYAWIEIFHLVLLFSLAVAVADACRRAPLKASKVIVAVVALGAFLYAVTFGVGYIGYLIGQNGLWPNTFFGFSNIRLFNQYQTWTLPLLAVAPMLMTGRSRFLRVALFGLLVLWWTLLFASGGRGTLVATLVAAGAVGLLYREAAKSWLKHQFAALCCGGGLFLLLFKAMAATQSSLVDRPMTKTGGRLEAWGAALEMTRQSPLFGVGPMHYAHYPAESTWASPHSAPLQLVAEWGVPAALLMLVLASWGLWVWISKNRLGLRSESEVCSRSVRVAVTAALLAGVVHSLVSGIIIAPMSQLLMVVLIGWAWGLFLKDEPIHSTSSGKSDRLLQVGLAVTLGALIWSVSQDISTLEKRPQAYFQVSGSLVQYPRYWQQGCFGLGIDIEEVDGSSRIIGIVGE